MELGGNIPMVTIIYFQVGESGMISVDSVEAIFETIPANKTEAGWLDSVSNFFGGNVSYNLDW